LTDILCAGIIVIALAVVDASGNRRAQVGEVDQTSGRNTLVVGTLGVGGNRDGGEDATLNWIARRYWAMIRSSARSNWGVDTHGGRGNHWVSNIAHVIGASVVIIAVRVGGTLRDWASRLVHNNTLNRIARNGGATIGDIGKRDGCLLTTLDWIASSSVTHILGVARNDWVRAEVLEGVTGIGHVAQVLGANVTIRAVSVVNTSRDRARGELECWDVSGGCIARIGEARCVCRNRNRCDNATSRGITSVDVAHIGLSARDSCVVANCGRRNHWVQGDANIGSASIVVIAVCIGSTLRNGASGFVEHYSLHRVARYNRATIGYRRKRVGGWLAT
jgi:hypothetical protein